MNNRLIIIGAGGHGKVIADIAKRNGYTDINFLDDFADGKCIDFPIIGKTDEIEALNDGKTDFIIGIGNNKIRKTIAEKFDVKWTSLIHPSAQIGMNVSVGLGTVVMAGAVINACSSIGCHCIVNSSSVIEHDNVIEDYVHISPRVALGGTVHIGEETHVGIGATVINNVNICHDSRIGAGAAVVNNIEKSGTFVGVPAKEII